MEVLGDVGDVVAAAAAVVVVVAREDVVEAATAAVFEFVVVDGLNETLHV